MRRFLICATIFLGQPILGTFAFRNSRRTMPHSSLVHFAGSRYATIALELQSRLEKNPSDEPALFNLGILLSQSTETKSQALKLFQTASILNPQRDANWYNLATLHDEFDDHESAISAFQKTIETSSSAQLISASYQNLINILLQQNRLDEAAKASNQAVKKLPQDPNSWCMMGIVLRTSHNNEWARLCFEKAVELSEFTDAVALNNLGVIYGNLGRHEDAIKAYNDALLVDAFDESSTQNLAVLYAEQGETALARKLFEQCLNINPANVHAQFQLQALQEDTSVAAAPKDYVVNLFDFYAAHGYDEHMVAQLEYQGPQLVWDATVTAYPTIKAEALRDQPAVDITVAELGCGTGLVGKLMRAKGFRGKLRGCDLSPGMIEKAGSLIYMLSPDSRAQDTEQEEVGLLPAPVYDFLSTMDCTQFLSGFEDSQLDALLAADVLVYIGNLESIVSGAHRVLQPGGVFVFTVEDLERETRAELIAKEKEGKCRLEQNTKGGLQEVVDNTSAEISTAVEKREVGGFRLRESARFAHTRSYVTALAAAAGFTSCDVKTAILRQQNGFPVHGLVVAMTK